MGRSQCSEVTQEGKVGYFCGELGKECKRGTLRNKTIPSLDWAKSNLDNANWRVESGIGRGKRC